MTLKKISLIAVSGIVVFTGLATVKKIIDLFNGNIWAESELGQGTIFYFTLNQP